MSGHTDERKSKTDIVRFGNYPFLADSDDYTPVEWLVLCEDEDRLLLISRYIIETLPDNAIQPGERLSAAAGRWMNSVLLDLLFPGKTRAALLPAGPDNTDEYFFLPDQQDLQAYQSSLSGFLRAELTDHAAARNPYTSSEKAEDGQPYGRWLLDDGEDPVWQTVFIDETGTLTRVNAPMKGVALRPAVRIDRNKALLLSGPNDPDKKYSHILRINHFF